jgi:hypothetical protein
MRSHWCPPIWKFGPNRWLLEHFVRKYEKPRQAQSVQCLFFSFIHGDQVFFLFILHKWKLLQWRPSLCKNSNTSMALIFICFYVPLDHKTYSSITFFSSVTKLLPHPGPTLIRLPQISSKLVWFFIWTWGMWYFWKEIIPLCQGIQKVYEEYNVPMIWLSKHLQWTGFNEMEPMASKPCLGFMKK